MLEEGGHLQGQLQSLVVLLQGPLQPQPPARAGRERWRAARAPREAAQSSGEGRQAGGSFGGGGPASQPAGSRTGSPLLSPCVLNSRFVEVLAPGRDAPALTFALFLQLLGQAVQLLVQTLELLLLLARAERQKSAPPGQPSCPPLRALHHAPA